VRRSELLEDILLAIEKRSRERGDAKPLMADDPRVVMGVLAMLGDRMSTHCVGASKNAEYVFEAEQAPEELGMRALRAFVDKVTEPSAECRRKRRSESR